MTTRGLWHVGFTVSDLNRSIPFYTEGLGLHVRHQQVQANAYTAALVGYPDVDLRMAQFALPDGNPESEHVLELAEYRQPRDEANPPGTSRVNSGHLALQVEDIDEVCRRVQAAGGTLVSPPQEITEGINTGGKAVYVRDPDGITIELVLPPQRPHSQGGQEG